MNWKEELKERIEACGQAVIDHAEDIAGNYKMMTYLSVEINPGDQNGHPEIDVRQSFVPEYHFDKDELKEPLDQYIL